MVPGFFFGWGGAQEELIEKIDFLNIFLPQESPFPCFCPSGEPLEREGQMLKEKIEVLAQNVPGVSRRIV